MTFVTGSENCAFPLSTEVRVLLRVTIPKISLQGNREFSKRSDLS